MYLFLQNISRFYLFFPFFDENMRFLECYFDQWEAKIWWGKDFTGMGSWYWFQNSDSVTPGWNEQWLVFEKTIFVFFWRHCVQNLLKYISHRKCVDFHRQLVSPLYLNFMWLQSELIPVYLPWLIWLLTQTFADILSRNQKSNINIVCLFFRWNQYLWEKKGFP